MKSSMNSVIIFFQVSTEDIDDAEEEEDLNKFDSQLKSIGLFGRLVCCIFIKFIVKSVVLFLIIING